MVIAASPLALKLGMFLHLSDAEHDALRRLQDRISIVERHDELVIEGSGIDACFVLLSGWAVSFKLLSDGRRQIVNIVLPGDFVGLRSVLLSLSDHSVVAVTKLKVARFSADELGKVMFDQSRIAIAILWALSRDEAIIVEHLVDLGRRNALQRLAHLLLELDERLKIVGLGTDAGFYCPLRQEDIADMLGLTTVHVNRSLRELRERQLASMSQRNIRLHDRAKLIELAQFDGRYLDHRTQPKFR